ncbi:PQQ enzyme repeat protein [Planctomycetes bacterium CA13]|uniref:PQQ enzyme repeat protein n=1 Tax=Novipirellula herctigrandis TaxID=2527986 RepID=A0A5C5YUV1_9BACT|nr:PQQ enzyme repeat protein [Planctomycetes bacterium CA13]
MNNPLTYAITILLSSCFPLAAFAQLDTPFVHGTLSGSVLATGGGRIMLLDQTGTIQWQHQGQNCSDVWMLDNGNVLHADNNVTEIDPKTNAIVWSYRPTQQKGGATFSCQRLLNGNTVVGENSAGRIVEVDKSGKVVFELKLPLTEPGSHNNLRMVRKLKNGNYLVCHKGESLVREYTPNGDVVFEVKVSDVPYSAVRLDSGHTMVGHINHISEYDTQGNIVWQFNKNELEGLDIGMICGIHVQPNGNVVMGIYRAVQKANGAGLLEITRSKELVWRYANTSSKADRNMMSVQLLDSDGKPLPGDVLR